MTATISLSAAPGSEFTISSFDPDTREEHGPRVTFRRVAATDLVAGDRLMDVYGNAGPQIVGVRTTARTVRVTTDYGHETFTLAEVLNVFVKSVAL